MVLQAHALDPVEPLAIGSAAIVARLDDQLAELAHQLDLALGPPVDRALQERHEDQLRHEESQAHDRDQRLDDQHLD